jgi:hypothetical protein
MKTISLMTITASMLIVTTFCKSKSQKDAEKYMNKIEDTLKENSGPKQMKKMQMQDRVLSRREWKTS